MDLKSIMVPTVLAHQTSVTVHACACLIAASFLCILHKVTIKYPDPWNRLTLISPIAVQCPTKISCLCIL